MGPAEVRVLPELRRGDPLRPARLASLDALRCQRSRYVPAGSVLVCAYCVRVRACKYVCIRAWLCLRACESVCFLGFGLTWNFGTIHLCRNFGNIVCSIIADINV